MSYVTKIKKGRDAPTILPHGVSSSCNYQRIYQHRTVAGDINVHKIPLGNMRKGLLENAYKHLLCTWRYDLKDVLKAPTGCAAKPAFFQPSATNHYVGANLGRNEDGHLMRPAYGSGSGATSIGLDPRHQRIHAMTPTAWKLCCKVTEAVMLARPELAERLESNPFNHVAHKGYYSYWQQVRRKGEMRWTQIPKRVDWHCDTTYTKGGVPMRNNSQVPNTIVAIFTFGLDKSLFFRKYDMGGRYDDETTLHFLQRHGTLYIIDCKDEKPDAQGKRWKHKSEMIHKDGVTFSLIFRCVQATAAVEPNGTMVAPVLSNRRRMMFEEAEHLFETDDYRLAREDLEARMIAFFQRYQTK